MINKPLMPHRKSTRLPNYDYCQTGAYFVTICVQNKRLLFGRIENGKMHLNKRGAIVERVWRGMSERFSDIILREYVVMPNHFHGIIQFCGDNTSSLSKIVAYFKYQSTKEINLDSKKLWQRSFYDHIIRSEEDYMRIADYIVNNPLRWEYDKFYLQE